MEQHILIFPKEGLKQLQFFNKGISFPVVVAAYSEQDIGKLSYLLKLVQHGDIRNTYSLCVWCIRQGISYQILFFITLRNLIRYPIRVYDYLRLQRALKKIQSVGQKENKSVWKILCRRRNGQRS